MAQNTYDEALRRVLVHEGGYSNHPSDPGGPTNYGITIWDYRKYINPQGTARDVRNMTVDEAKKIFRERYWNVQRCDELPPGVDYCVFDYGVNSGIGRSGKVLRRLVGQKDHTHVISDEVIAAAAKRDPLAIIDAICMERLRFLKGLKTWSTFGRGWERRVREVREASRAMILNKSLPAQTPGITGTPMAKETSPAAKTGTAVVAAGTLGFATVYNWVIENPILAALIVQAFIALAILIVHHRDEASKPDPLPISFDALPPAESDEFDDDGPISIESKPVDPKPAGE